MAKPFTPVKMHCPKHGAMYGEGDWIVMPAYEDEETAAILHCSECLWEMMTKLATPAPEPVKRKKRAPPARKIARRRLSKKARGRVAPAKKAGSEEAYRAAIPRREKVKVKGMRRS